MSYTVITPASLKALTVQEVKDYLRVDSSDEDTLLGVLIDAATQVAEHYLGRFLFNYSSRRVLRLLPSIPNGRRSV